eukprot:9097210-Pyramimonas_sp.AAC.1
MRVGAKRIPAPPPPPPPPPHLLPPPGCACVFWTACCAESSKTILAAPGPLTAPCRVRDGYAARPSVRAARPRYQTDPTSLPQQPRAL